MRRILSATLWLCAFTAISLSAETLQVIADNAPVMRGKDVDKPRNLAKSVTVE